MESIYGTYLPELKQHEEMLLAAISSLRERIRSERGSDPVEHCLSRIKDEESMREKCRRKGLPEEPDAALYQIHDALGLRIVCAFINDVYLVREMLIALPGVTIAEEKDYIRRAKENGYRSLHLILRFDDGLYAEFQLRTISMDTWAALEHHLKYKKNLGANTGLIVKELKRCADELASTDLSMQTIRDMIEEL